MCPGERGLLIRSPGTNQCRGTRYPHPALKLPGGSSHQWTRHSFQALKIASATGRLCAWLVRRPYMTRKPHESSVNLGYSSRRGFLKGLSLAVAAAGAGRALAKETG